MRTTVKNTNSHKTLIFKILNIIRFTNKADVCEQAVRIAENKFA